ncbi:molecular mechanism For the regulation of protein kinase B Akt By hydrophobic motif phosphorylation [Cladochytrium replicatum]|nr:molecular mechanism For the regulation of protein kinase B Akt By hydrophobic motif phosphorylation [Cladochytrium replicatum]
MTIKDFEIHKVIGRGKFAKVLLCSQKSTGKVYAIKVMSKGEPGDSNTESQILRSIRHPFIVGLHYAFESKERLYLVMVRTSTIPPYSVKYFEFKKEYVNGGELYFHISNFGRFSEERVCFYAAEILLAVGCLHRKGVIYRDLKLENVLLAKDGHVKITDFGLSKQGADVESEVIEIVGTLEYLAPEVILGREYSFAADWWAYGVILFEMLCGFHPFYDEDPNKIRKLIVDGLIEFPHFVSKESVDLLVRLLNRNPSERIKMEDIQKHVFFSTIDFDKLFRKELPPPFVPELVDDFDVRFFDEIFTEEPVSWTPIGSEEMLNSL